MAERGAVTRFWEIEQIGASLMLRSGKVGSRALPDEKEESYRNATEAKREAERLVRSRLENGWVEVVQQALVEQFEAALAADDQAQWAVFADRLQAEGDVRGEFIALLQSVGKKREGKKQVEAFVATHEDALLGSLAEFQSQLSLEWKNGYLHEVAVFCEPSEDGEQQSVEDLVPLVLSLESSRFLRALLIGWPEEGADCSYEPTVEVLKKERWPTYLERLVLGDFSESTALSSVASWAEEEWLDEETELDLWPDLRSLAPLADKLASLRGLTVRANLRRLGVTRLERMEALELHAQHVESALVDEVLNLHAPALRALVVDFPESPSVTPGSFARVLEGVLFPKLERLGLCGLGSEVVGLMARAKRLPSLKVVDLSGNDLGDEAVATLLSHREAFAHLDKLLVRRNLFSKAGLRELKAELPNADVAHQRSRRGAALADRYDEVGE